MKEPLISVIVPVYNVEKYIEQCVESILNQTYKNLEIILVNDGSIDNSGEICDNYAKREDRVKVIHQLNGGSSIARNNGFNLSTGELIIFIDGDDYWDESNALSKIAQKLLSQKDAADFIVFNYKKAFQKSNLLIATNDISQATQGLGNKKDKLNALIKKGIFPLSPWDKLVKRDFLLKNNISFIENITHQDLPWSIELFVKCKNFSIAEEYLYIYRKQVDGAITGGFSEKKYFDLLFIIKHTLEKLNDEYENSSIKNEIYCILSYQYAILIGLTANFKNPKFMEVIQEIEQYRWLLRYGNNKKVLLTQWSVNLLGLKITAYLLRFYIRKFVSKVQ